ncbi:MAG: AAA family ATPase [Victivallales bacterium]|jgi:predicted AAA+ superfamily ATPase|nr:AAA family ATPase [Victivallales bacterium]
MIKRKCQKKLSGLVKKFQIVTILGPRGAGKTTLARTQFPDYTYVDLEDPETRLLARQDYREFVARYPAPVIIDEIHRVPQLFGKIKTIIEKNRKKNGQVILIDSCESHFRFESPQMRENQMGYLHLLPLSISELNESGIHLARDEYRVSLKTPPRQKV